MNCLQCGEPISHGLFCCGTCAEEWHEDMDTYEPEEQEPEIENPIYPEPEEIVDGGEWAEQHDRMED